MGELNAGIFQVGPDVSGGEAQKACLDELRKIAVSSRRPLMLGALSSSQGDNPNPFTYQFEWMDRVAAEGGRVFGQATTRSINALFSMKSYLPFDALPVWNEIRNLPVEEQKARFRDPEVRVGLVAAEARMKPKGTEFQGGGAATTDPRKPDYANLFPMFDVKWDDPSVEDLAQSSGRNPVEVMLDLMAENEDLMFVQPLVNEKPLEVREMLKNPRTLADLLGLRRPCVPGDGLVAANASAELLGARQAGVHPGGGGAHAHLRECRCLGHARPGPAAHRPHRRHRRLRRGGHKSLPAHRPARPARRGATLGAKGPTALRQPSSTARSRSATANPPAPIPAR